MRKPNKIINIALIFMLSSAFWVQGYVWSMESDKLRVPMDGHKRMEEVLEEKSQGINKITFLEATIVEVDKNDEVFIRQALEEDKELILENEILSLIESIKKAHKVLIATIDKESSEIIGYALFDMKRIKGAYLERIFTVPKYQKRGNTSLLIEYAQIKFSRIGVLNVIYDTGIEQKMHSEYKRLGFGEVKEDIVVNLIWEKGVSESSHPNQILVGANGLSVEKTEPAKTLASNERNVTVEVDKEQKTMLLIDDKEIFRTSLKILFSQRGFNIIAVETAGKGLEVLASRKVDIVISDIFLPGMNGDVLARKIKAEINVELPIILIATSDDETIRRKNKEFQDLDIPVFDKLHLENLSVAVEQKIVAFQQDKGNSLKDKIPARGIQTGL